MCPGYPKSPICPGYHSYSKSLVALFIDPAGEYRASSDMSWSVVGLVGMVTIGAAPETRREKSLGDADESDEAYSCRMMGKKAGNLLCSLTCILTIHLSISSIKVQIPRPWLDKQRVSSTSILFKVPGCTNLISRFSILP